MRNLILTALLSLVTMAFIEPSLAHNRHNHPVHILPDQEISYDQISMMATLDMTSDYVNEAIRVGKKNMDWLKHMNSLRPDDQKIALTKPGELTPIPIHKPKIYSPDTVERDFKELFDAIPESMKAIIFGTAPFIDNPDVDLATYILWAKKVDKMYQTAARWVTMQPYMGYYYQNKIADIRGYYYLIREENLNEKLESFSTLKSEEQERLKPLLVNICENSDGLTGCDKKLDAAISGNTVLSFYKKYFDYSKKTYEEYFIIGGIRPDLVWTSTNPNLASIPIRDTKNAEINHFLEFNNEDEWKWGDWKLDLYFTPDADIHVDFVPGATPHVNGLGGNQIVMDGNAPLTEWDVQWTIRHEFGHVLGLPDCYVEFYDQNLKAMVNYQIDTENMMCSRAGRMQEIHYTELKRVYYKQ